MILPTIHSNGSDKRDLFDGYIAAILAVESAIDATSRAAPHGRDYYVQGPDALRQATAEHQRRVQQLNAVCLELVKLAEHVAP